MVKQTRGSKQKLTSRSQQANLHRLWTANQSEAYKKRDLQFRIFGVGALVVGFAIAGLGYQMGVTAVIIVGMVLAIGGFGVALGKASRYYHASRKQWVKDQMAEDGTFLFCPQCDYDLRKCALPIAACPECGTKPYRFDPEK